MHEFGVRGTPLGRLARTYVAIKESEQYETDMDKRAVRKGGGTPVALGTPTGHR